jgi:hypothetical protein
MSCAVKTAKPLPVRGLAPRGLRSGPFESRNQWSCLCSFTKLRTVKLMVR